jgi:hypothetical protein
MLTGVTYMVPRENPIIPTSKAAGKQKTFMSIMIMLMHSCLSYLANFLLSEVHHVSLS